ncbi:MAG TPA: hypothetical protein LFW20_02175 [Rickettsia endosymbiont of Omalisus fontisbellaquei]|nr:hypothetical protein [Rickettsia endosymbiont of Omalisus fontisbellaquei]
MNKDKPFGYSAVAKYIGNKFIAELWQQKYTIISTILFAYISSVSGENNDDIEQREKQSFDNSFSDILVQLGNDLRECQYNTHRYNKFIEGQRDTIREQATLIKFMNEGLKSLCSIVAGVSVSNDTYSQFCGFVNNGAIDLLGTQYEQIDLIHDEL